MDPIPNETWRSLARSRNRLRVLMTIASLGEAYVGQIAQLCNMREEVVRMVLHGRLPSYSPELSLIALRLVEERATRHGRVYVITSRGIRKARSVSAGRVRRREARRDREPLF